MKRGILKKRARPHFCAKRGWAYKKKEWSSLFLSIIVARVRFHSCLTRSLKRHLPYFERKSAYSPTVYPDEMMLHGMWPVLTLERFVLEVALVFPSEEHHSIQWMWYGTDLNMRLSFRKKQENKRKRPSVTWRCFIHTKYDSCCSFDYWIF